MLKLGEGLAFRCGELSLARSLIGEALLFYRKVADTTNSARVLTLLGLIATNEGEPADAVPLLEESIPVAREGGDARALDFALTNLPYVLLATGDVERAYEASLDAIAFGRTQTAGTVPDPAAALHSAGLAALLLGRLDEARNYLAESLSHRLRIEDAHGLASIFTSFAAVAVEDAAYERAARLLGATDGVCERTDAQLEPLDADLYERTAAAARSTLGNESFARAHEEGRNLGLEEAAAVALE